LQLFVCKDEGVAGIWTARLNRVFRPRKEGRYGSLPGHGLALVDDDLLSGQIGQMKPRDRLLLFLALDGAPEGLDPVRLQKGMFLFSQEAASSEDEKYQFVPYNYGPMSTQIYKDLESLEAQGLVESVPVRGQSWARYSATKEGLIGARDLLAQEPSESAAQRLHAIKREVASKSFSAVLEDVYDRYPQYASKSVFRRAS
jgi:DNA-binding PadR family transcriptional regulator